MFAVCASGPSLLLGLLAIAPGKQPNPPASLHLGTEHRVIARHAGGVCGLSFSPDGKLVASMGGDSIIRLTDPATGKEVRCCTGHTKFLRCGRFSPDGKLLASGGDDPQVHLYDPATGKELRRLGGHQGGLRIIVFTPDSKTMITGGFDEHIRVLDIATGKEARAWRAHQRVVYGLAVSPDGKTLASGGDREGKVRLWDVATGKELRSWMGHADCVYSVAFSPDGRHLASAGGDGIACLWDAATGEKVRSFAGHDGGGGKVAFSPDGRFLVVASHNKNVRVWERASGKEVYRFGDHQGWVWGTAYAPDGRSLVSGSNDGTAVLWKLDLRPRRGVALTAQEREALWRDLAGEDAARALAAVWALCDTKAASVADLGKRLRPAAAAKLDHRRVEQLIADLDSDEFQTRQKGSQELDRLGAAVLPALRRALVKPPSLEARQRLAALVKKHAGGELSGEELRAVRALQVLEDAGTAEAREVLKSLAAGDPGAALSREARATLARLAKKSVP